MLKPLPRDVPPMYELNALRALAEQASQHAYAPYSNLRVGAALRSASGQTYAGCNVENASFSVGNCAETAAIAAAVQAEGKSFRLAAIAVAAFTTDGTALPVSPCGACRQAMVEFGPQAVVSFRQSDGHWTEVGADALLPFCFTLPAR